MSAEKEMAKIIEAARQMEIEENEQKNEELAQSFFDNVIAPVKNKNLQDEVEKMKAELDHYRSIVENWEEFERQASSLDRLAENVHSALWKSEPANLPSLQKKVQDAVLQRLNNHLQLWTKEKEQTDSEYFSNPEVRELMDLQELEAKTARSVQEGKNELEKLTKSYNELKRTGMDEQNNFILRLLEEKRIYEENMKELSEIRKSTAELTKEEDRLKQELAEKTSILEEARERNRQRKEQIRLDSLVHCDQLEHVDMIELDAISVSPPYLQSPFKKNRALNKPKDPPTPSVSASNELKNISSHSAGNTISRSESVQVTQTSSHSLSAEIMRNASSSTSGVNMPEQKSEPITTTPSEKSGDNQKSVPPVHFTPSKGHVKAKAPPSVKQVPIASSSPSVRFSQIPQPTTSLEKENMQSARKPEAVEVKSGVSTHKSNEALSSEMTQAKGMGLDLGALSEDNSGNDTFKMNFEDDFDMDFKIGDDFDLGGNAGAGNASFEFNDFLNTNMPETEVTDTDTLDFEGNGASGFNLDFNF